MFEEKWERWRLLAGVLQRISLVGWLGGGPGVLRWFASIRQEFHVKRHRTLVNQFIGVVGLNSQAERRYRERGIEL